MGDFDRSEVWSWLEEMCRVLRNADDRFRLAVELLSTFVQQLLRSNGRQTGAVMQGN